MRLSGLFLIALIFVLCAEALLMPHQQPVHKVGKRATCGTGEQPNNYDPLTLKFYNGPVSTDPNTVYIVYYGASWQNLTALKEQMTYFINNVATSNWFSYTRALTDNDGNHITNNVTFGGSIDETNLTKFGFVVEQNVIVEIIQNAITTGAFPLDKNAQYYVFNGDDTRVTPDGSSIDYCGYHSRAEVNNTQIKYGFIVTDSKNLVNCSFANSGPYTDVINSAVTTLAHEIIETLTDPFVGSPTDGGAGYLTSGPVPAGSTQYYENGDMCANIDFSSDSTVWMPADVGGGKVYSITVGPENRQYLVQANLNTADNCCGYPAGPAPSTTGSVSPVMPGVSQTGTAGPTPAPTSAAPGASPSETPAPSYVYPSDLLSNTYNYYYCGDGYVDPDEQCDPGFQYYYNHTFCCNTNCHWKKPGSLCGKRQGPCYLKPRCMLEQPGQPNVQCVSNLVKKKGKGCKTTDGSAGKCDGHGVCNAITSS